MFLIYLSHFVPFSTRRVFLGGNNWVGLESGSVHRGVKFWLTVCSSTSDGRRGVHERWYRFAHLLSLKTFLRVQSCSIAQNIYSMTPNRAQASHASQAPRLLHVRHPFIYTTMIQIQMYTVLTDKYVLANDFILMYIYRVCRPPGGLRTSDDQDDPNLRRGLQIRI